jgi:hypothetical protein
MFFRRMPMKNQKVSDISETVQLAGPPANSDIQEPQRVVTFTKLHFLLTTEYQKCETNAQQFPYFKHSTTRYEM